MKHYAEDAALEAAQRADAMLETGSLGGQRVWKRVLGLFRAARAHELAAVALPVAAWAACPGGELAERQGMVREEVLLAV